MDQQDRIQQIGWMLTTDEGWNFGIFVNARLSCLTILRKLIEGYLDSVPSLTFNAMKTKPIMHAFHSSRYLQSN